MTQLPNVDDLGRPVISSPIRQQINQTFGSIEPGKRGALVLVADKGTETVRAHVAAKIGDHWKVAAGGGWEWSKKSPDEAFVAVVGSW